MTAPMPALDRSRRVRQVALVIGVLIVAPMMVACGSQDAEYCKQTKSAADDLERLEAGDIEAIDSSMAALRKLAKAAPSEIKPQWKIYDAELASAQRALKKSGLKSSDFKAVAEGKLPRGVKANDVNEVVRAFDALKEPKVTGATDEIRQHAKDKCDISLAGASSQDPS